jgi:outer membrane protein assembly factor BamB
LYKAKRPLLRPSFVLLMILVSLLLAACGGVIGDENWPGMTAVGDRVYIAHGQAVTAVDIATRQQLWSFPTDGARNLQFFAPPSLEEGRIILGDFGAAQGFLSPRVYVTIYAMQETGAGMPTPLWATGELARGRIVAPPLQVGNRVFIGTADNEVLAVDATSGVLLWKFTTAHSVWARPVYEEGVLYIASLDKTLYALTAATGEEIWRRQLSGAIASSPALGDRFLYVPSFDQQVHALDKDTGEEMWTAAAANWVWGSPTLDNGVLYYADIGGNVFAVDANNGAEIWRQNVPGAVQADPVVADGRVFIVSAVTGRDGAPEQGVVTAFAAADGLIEWQQRTSAPLFTTPVIAGDALVVAQQSQEALLLVFDLPSGNQLWSMPPAVAGR